MTQVQNIPNLNFLYPEVYSYNGSANTGGNIHHSKQSKDIVDRSLICSFKQRNKVNKNNLKIENKTKFRHLANKKL